MPKLKSLDDLFVLELRDIYNAEQQITRALPKMAKAAESDELRAAFEEHLEMTKNQITRLEKVFDLLGMKASGKKCEGMEGLISEGKEIMEMEANPDVRDAALISAAQKVEHYEIASYGCLATYAGLLGYDQAKQLLGETLQEEEETDQKLTQLAEAFVNQEATAGDE